MMVLVEHGDQKGSMFNAGSISTLIAMKTSIVGKYIRMGQDQTREWQFKIPADSPERIIELLQLYGPMIAAGRASLGLPTVTLGTGDVIDPTVIGAVKASKSRIKHAGRQEHEDVYEWTIHIMDVNNNYIIGIPCREDEVDGILKTIRETLVENQIPFARST